MKISTVAFDKLSEHSELKHGKNTLRELSEMKNTEHQIN